MGKERKVRYLGDVVNSSGTMCDTIADRVARGTRCIVNCFSEVTDVTMGVQQIKTLILLYNSIFIPTVLFNCEAWNNVSTKEMKNLSILQLKYLKRMLQVPSSTPNISVLLELGIKPIEQEIHIRQLGFLYHILFLEEDDPVRKVYQQHKLYHKEKNWFNEAMELLKKYRINKSEEEILKMGRNRWKNLVKT